MSSTVRTGIGALMLALGLLWFGQGMGWIGGSVMTGVTFWAVVGPLVALAGLALVLTARGGRRTP